MVDITIVHGDYKPTFTRVYNGLWVDIPNYLMVSITPISLGFMVEIPILYYHILKLTSLGRAPPCEEMKTRPAPPSPWSQNFLP